MWHFFPIRLIANCLAHASNYIYKVGKTINVHIHLERRLEIVKDFISTQLNQSLAPFIRDRFESFHHEIGPHWAIYVRIKNFDGMNARPQQKIA